MRVDLPSTMIERRGKVMADWAAFADGRERAGEGDSIPFRRAPT